MAVRVLLPLLPMALIGALTACGEPVVLDAASPAETPYDGPLTSGPRDEDSPDVAERGGAAVAALECTHPPDNGGGADYDSGLSTVQDDAGSALADWIAEDWHLVPGSGYVVERWPRAREPIHCA